MSSARHLLTDEICDSGAAAAGDGDDARAAASCCRWRRMWAASGVDYPTLLATMVDTAIARGTGLR